MNQRNANDQLTERNAEIDNPKRTLERQKSFHLLKHTDTPAESTRPYLIKYDFKQRIDSMFDETRSAIIESENIERHKRVFRAVQSECGAEPTIGSRRRSNLLEKQSKIECSNERKIKNTVQARIEKMFADISSSEVEDESGTPTVHRFQVDHIGSLPLFSKITSLQGLQEPLKNLYFNYRKTKFPSSKLQALLEISSLGLKVQNFEQNHCPIKEQLNPFPSIAVWAALKFVCRPQQTSNKMGGNSGLEYAFLPIVLDQNNTEKSSLFRPLDQSDISCAMEKTYDDHSPLFVVIMRNGSSNNRLLCHGFACATSEDAIILAANLYKALVSKMNRTHHESNSENGSLKKRKKVKCRNGLGTVCSVAGSSVCGEGESDYLFPEKKFEDISARSEETQKPKKIPPPRPQRKNKPVKNTQNISNSVTDLSAINFESDEIIAVEDLSPALRNDILTENKTDGRSVEVEIIKNEKTCRYETGNGNKVMNASACSWRSANSEKIESGDILTKVVIPRSGSFLNASGPLTSRYGRFNGDRGAGRNSYYRKNSIHSPLGFIEIFNELRIHEGLNNIDEILNTIIDVDGMSFNSLKPIYKEFIFKLAVTLTKDELYQRSKSIMQKQKRRKRQMAINRRRKTFVSGYKIKRAFHTSISKLKSTSKIKIGLPFSSHIIPAIKKIHQHNKTPNKTKMKLKRQSGPTSTLSLTSKESFETLLGFKGNNYSPSDIDLGIRSDDIYKGEILFHRKNFLTGTCTRVQNMTMTFQPTDLRRNSLRNEDILAATEDRKTNRHHHQRNRTESVQEYVSCSECSYNSESCKYRTSRKCYCSMRRRRTGFKVKRRDGDTGPLDGLKQPSVSSCSCDTDSCVESEKCYCDSNKKPSIFEQLKRQGFAASESSLSRPSSPVTPRRTNDNMTVSEDRGKTCLQASKSLEFFHVQKNASDFQLNYGENRVNPTENRRKLRDERQTPSLIPSGSNSHTGRNADIRAGSKKANSLASAEEDDPTSEDDVDQENNNNNNNNNSINFRPFSNSEDGLNRTYIKNYNRIDFDDDSYYGKHNGLNPKDFFADDRPEHIPEQKKILVVSARDQKGKVKNSVTPLYNKSKFSSSNFPLKFLKNENIHETDAISIKKTAEIAALFSNIKVEKKNHINIRCSKDIIYNSLDPSSGFLRSRTGNRQMPIKKINLENSLGYFP